MSVNNHLLTCLIQHLVALVENEHLEVFELQIFSAWQSQDSTWSSDDDMWACLWVFQKLHIIIDWNTTVKSGTSDLLQVFCESVKFLLDLVGQLSGVAQDKSWSWLWISLINLVEDRQDEDSGLSHTRDSLAENILSGNCSWDALLLNLRWMLKTALSDGSGEFRLQKEVSKGSSMYSSISGHSK